MLNRLTALVFTPAAALLLVALLVVPSWSAAPGGAAGNVITSPDTAGLVGGSNLDFSPDSNIRP